MITEYVLILLFLLPFILVRKMQGSVTQFFKGRHILNTWYISLSAVATNHSAFVYLGQIGFTYIYGLESLWLTVGWKLGDWISMIALQPRLKKIIKEKNIFTISELVKSDDQSLHSYTRLIFGCIALLGLIIYSSAQISAVEKMLDFYQVENKLFIIISMLAVIFYYLNRGGFDASVKTDTPQALIMFISVSMVFYFGLMELGGFNNAYLELLKIETETKLIVDPFNLGTPSSVAFFLIGWFFAGAGTIAQPHILMRFMASENLHALRLVQIKYILISTLFSLPILGIALIAKVLIPPGSITDPELALLVLTQSYLPEYFVLILVMGVISAAMSTLDSLVIASSTIIVKDTSPVVRRFVISPRIATGVVLIAIYIYWVLGNSSVFKTIISSWSLVASIYLPLILLKLLKIDMNQKGILFGAVTSIATLYLWRSLALDTMMYELLPATIMYFFVYWCSHFLTSSSRLGKNADY